MLRNIIKFATVGIEFNTRTTVPIETIQARLKRFSVFKAIFEKNERIVARYRKEKVKLYRLGVPILILGKPVLYVQVMVGEPDTLVSGRFTFSIFSRVCFWLCHLSILVLIGIGVFRIAIAHTHDAPIAWYLYGVLSLVIGGMLGFFTYSWYGWTWHNRRNDLTTLADSFKDVLRARTTDSPYVTQ